MVSPALGVLLVQDHEIRRGLIRGGASPEAAATHLSRLLATTEADLTRSRQRIALWTVDKLHRRTRVTLSRPA
jgi:hypothetical protein